MANDLILKVEKDHTISMDIQPERSPGCILYTSGDREKEYTSQNGFGHRTQES